MDLMKIDFNSEFSLAIKEVFEKYCPRKLIETGTYLGMGSTAIIASTLKKMGLTRSQFFSIEVNPQYYKQAIDNITKLGLFDFVTIVWGLSIKREHLPSLKKIEEQYIKRIWPPRVYIDHTEDERIASYFRETNFKDAPDNLLFQCLKRFDFHPDFVLLDSGGHIGHLEFHVLLNSLVNPCIVALDDINHVKHYESFFDIQQDKRFRIIKKSDEKFGFCIAYFIP